jgi:putative hydrolase of HD superfamily
MKLQRWNVMPRIEIWTEAENIAYTTHLVYALGRQLGLGDGDLYPAVERSLLKSVNKHDLSDVPIGTRDCMRDLNPNAWESLVNTSATKSANLFPRVVASELRPFMTFQGDYTLEGAGAVARKARIEELIHFAQYQSALEECHANVVVYASDYSERIASIEKKMSQLHGLSDFVEALTSLADYTPVLRRMKYLRRWNKMNRSVESTVMGHTFVVALLALLFARMASHKHNPQLHKTSSHEPVFEAVIRSMFHDLPESFTGDIISPVKAMIEGSSPGIIEKVEATMQQAFREKLPKAIESDIVEMQLLDELSDKEPYTVSSLVKSCDRLGLVLECLFEANGAETSPEMVVPLRSYVSELQNCEFAPIREFCTQVSLEFPALRR